MEAGEFAIRLARAITQRNGIVGFAGSMYGKSIATAYLGWDNQNPVSLTGWHRLPFVADCAEDFILSRLQETLISKTIAAVFMEPIQGSNGGHCASRRFYQEVFHLCQEQGTLLVFDEILTGFYRTGSAFCFSEVGFVPDVVLIGKAIANGFPISGVVVNKNYPIEARMLPGSTFAGNPLAAAAVLATLKQIRVLQISDKVMKIAQVIKDYFKPLKNMEVILRGKGALWILELPENLAGQAIALRLAKRGVIVSYANHWLRILPAATIELDNLKNACDIIREEIYEAYRNASK